MSVTTSADELREQVRRHYAEAATAVSEGKAGGCCDDSCCSGDEQGSLGEALYGI